MTPGGGKAPAAMNVNRDSRSALRSEYELCIKIFHRRIFENVPDFGIFINFDMDVVHMNPLAHYLENPRDDDEVDEDLLDSPTGDLCLERAAEEYTLWIKRVKNIAFDLESDFGAWSVVETWASILHAEPELSIVDWCPSLENLFIIQENDIGTDFENLEVTTSGTFEEVRCMNSLVKKFDKVFHQARTGNQFNWWDHKLTLKFMKKYREVEEEDSEEEFYQDSEEEDAEEED